MRLLEEILLSIPVSRRSVGAVRMPEISIFGLFPRPNRYRRILVEMVDQTGDSPPVANPVKDHDVAPPLGRDWRFNFPAAARPERYWKRPPGLSGTTAASTRSKASSTADGIIVATGSLTLAG